MHMVLEGLLVSILQRHLGQFLDSDLKSLKVRRARTHESSVHTPLIKLGARSHVRARAFRWASGRVIRA